MELDNPGCLDNRTAVRDAATESDARDGPGACGVATGSTRRFRPGRLEDAGAVARLLFVVVLVTAAVAVPAEASITVTTGAQRPALRVDARGNAEVSWTSGGRREYLLVPPTGRFFPGKRLPGRDVSRPAADVSIPYRKVVRRTPDGRLWALQVWRVAFAKVDELRFSRWRGEPTRITLRAAPSRRTELLRGRATFQGRPVTGTSPTNAGTPILHAAFVDCWACGGKGWVRFNNRRTGADGSFSITVPLDRRGSRYRVSIAGPNSGATLAPDASAIAPSVR